MAVKKGDAAIDLLRSHGIDNLVFFNGYEAIIQAAKEHKVNVFVIDKPPALYFLYKYGIQMQYNTSLPFNVGEFHRAVKKGNAVLLQQIESGFARISPKEYQQIEKKWYGAPLLRFVSAKDVLIGTGIPFLLFIGLFYWNYSLRTAVKKRTTELEKSKDELRKSDEQYCELVENANSIILRRDRNGRISFFNEFAQCFFGYQAEEVIGKNVVGTIVPELGSTGENLRAMIADIGLRPDHYATNENENMLRDGTRAWISWTNKPLYNTAGEVSEILCVGNDISDRKRAEDALRESEERYRSILNASPDDITITDMEGRVLMVSPAGVTMFGYERECEGLDRLITDFIAPEDRERSLANFTRKVQGVLSGPDEYHGLRKDGSIFDIEVASDFIRGVEGKPTRVVFIVRDITKRKVAENALRESEDKFSLTFNSSPDSININRMDDGQYVEINGGFTRITGFTRDDVIGKTSAELSIWYDPADREQLVHGLREKGFFENLEAQFRMKDGSLITGLMSARVIYLKGVPHIVSITRDITELKTHEIEQLKIEKLESLGILAGGIAHDFNNILTAIIGNVSFAKIFLDTTHNSYKPLIEAEKAAVRAGELAHQLLTFARGGEPIKKVVPPQHLVNEALSFVLHGSNIMGIADIPESIHAFEVDEGQMSQVFQNIIINSRQAMPEGGTLFITARNEVLYDSNVLSLPAGSYIRLTFADQGCGISGENLKRIFDPYFTTKSAGNGLGLSSVHSIVNRHGGHIGVTSIVDKGTTFIIYLPSIGMAYTKYQQDVVEQVNGEHKGGSILVMDDDEMIRNIATSILTHLGYKVVTCADGEKAVEHYKASMESGTPFAMVIMDLTIPGGFGGKQAAEQILSLYPKACLVVSSGYSNDPIMSNYQEFGFSGAISKPYNVNKFQEVLNPLLTGG